MRLSPLVYFLVTELSATLALPLGYGVAEGSCGPPGLFCFRKGIGCAAVCTNAWAQFPTVAAFGAAIGIVPALLVALLIFSLEHRNGPRWSASRWYAMPALGVAGMVGALVLMVLVLPSMGAYLVGLVAGFGLLLAFSLGAGCALAARLRTRPTRPNGM